MKNESAALLTDLYQLTMLQGYFKARMEDVAVFEFFVRRLPVYRNFLIAAGLDQLLQFFEQFHFSDEELEWLKSTGHFHSDFLRYLGKVRFTGTVHAMEEGTFFFTDEPIVRITAPMPEAQIIETRLINILQFQTMIASKAVRCCLGAPGKTLVDFGLRRAHGAEAGLLAARACFLAGFHATSDVLAGKLFQIPVSGTMAHSFVEACDSEEDAFITFARANPENTVLLIDTYDTEAAAAKVVQIAPELQAEGISIQGVRLDSGDLGEHARKVRRILDEGGLAGARIFASGNLDEFALEALASSPIDGFGVGSKIITSSDAPYLDCAYKIQEYAGELRCKSSEGKSTWPGRKQVFRRLDRERRMSSDIVALENESEEGEPLLKKVMEKGKRVSSSQTLPDIREKVARQTELLPTGLRSLKHAEPYAVVIADSLRNAARRIASSHLPTQRLNAELVPE